MRITCLKLKDSLNYPKVWLIKILEVSFIYLHQKPSDSKLMVNIKNSHDNEIYADSTSFKQLERAIFIYNDHRLEYLSTNRKASNVVNEYSDNMLDYLLNLRNSSRIKSANILRRKINDIDSITDTTDNQCLTIRYWFNLAYIYISDPTLFREYYTLKNNSLNKLLQLYANLKDYLGPIALAKKCNEQESSNLVSGMIHATKLNNTKEIKKLFLFMLNIDEIKGVNKDVVKLLKDTFIKIFITPYDLTNISLDNLLIELETYNDTYLLPNLTIVDLILAIKYLSKYAAIEQTSEKLSINQLNYKVNKINKQTHIDKLNNMKTIGSVNDLTNVNGLNIKVWLKNLSINVVYNAEMRINDVLNTNKIIKVLHPENDFVFKYSYILVYIKSIYDLLSRSVYKNNDEFFYNILFLNNIKFGPKVSINTVRKDILFLLWPLVEDSSHKDIKIVKTQLDRDLRITECSLSMDDLAKCIKVFFRNVVWNKNNQKNKSLCERIISISKVDGLTSVDLDIVKKCIYINLKPQQKENIKEAMKKISDILHKDVSVAFPKVISKAQISNIIKSFFDSIVWKHDIKAVSIDYHRIIKNDEIENINVEIFNKVKQSAKNCLRSMQNSNTSFKDQVNVIKDVSQRISSLLDVNVSITWPVVFEKDEIAEKIRNVFKGVIWDDNKINADYLYNQIMSTDKIEQLSDNDLHKLKRCLKECIA